MKDIVSKLAEQFNLTEEEKKELLPSGVALIFENRTHWARYYLKKAGLLDTFKRGTITITQRGSDTVKSNPSAININFLRQFPEFNQINNQKSDTNSLKINSISDSNIEILNTGLKTGLNTITIADIPT